MSRAKKVAHATPFLALNVPPKPRVLANDVITVAARAMDVLQQVRDAILMPHPRKNPPSFTTKELMDLLELDRNQLKAKEISIGKTFGSIKEGELKKHTL